jgi:hypothetical protein
LRRPVRENQGAEVFSLLQTLLRDEQHTLYGCLRLESLPPDAWDKVQKKSYFMQLDWPWLTSDRKFNERKLSKEQRFILAKFRLAAKYHFPKPRAVRKMNRSRIGALRLRRTEQREGK